MKPSHTTTPRSLNECVFMLDADPIDRPESHSRPMWPLWVAAGIVGAMLLMLATPARATTKPPVVQPPPASAEYSVDAAATASAQAAALAGAQSGSVATGVGLGGASTSSGTGTGGQSSSTSGGSYAALNGGSTRTNVAVLPQPVWTMVPPAADCIATSSRAFSAVLGFVSASKSDQKSDPVCAGIIMAKAAYDHCHFESEQMIMARIYETLFPGAPALPMVPGARNHSLAECEDMKRPRLAMTPVMVPTPAPIPVEPALRAPKVDRQ